jgi:hypothetical protein
MIAGPSEVLIIADHTANPDWIAADLLAQAEHDAAAQSILITDDAASPTPSSGGRRQLVTLPRATSPRELGDFGAIIVDASPGRGIGARRPHRRRASRDHGRRRRSSRRARSATPAPSSSARTRRRRSATMSAAPTTCCRRRARRAFSSGLGVLDFMKRTSILKCDAADALRALGPAAIALGEAEGWAACALRRHPAQHGASMTDLEALRRNRLCAVTLDDASIGAARPIRSTSAPSRSTTSSRKILRLPDHAGGPYQLNIALHNSKLALDIRSEAAATRSSRTFCR